MAVMTYSSALLPLPEAVPSKEPAAARPSFFTRLLNAMMESRFRTAEREIARHRALVSGGVATLKVDPQDLPFDNA